MAKLKMSTRRAARRRLLSAQDIVGGGGTGSDICALLLLLLLLCFRVPIDNGMVGIVVLRSGQEVSVSWSICPFFYQ
jgi:hypothetical protein